MTQLLNWLGRLVCRLRGHLDPDVYILPNRGIVVTCPRCRLILAGQGHVRPRKETP